MLALCSPLTANFPYIQFPGWCLVSCMPVLHLCYQIDRELPPLCMLTKRSKLVQRHDLKQSLEECGNRSFVQVLLQGCGVSFHGAPRRSSLLWRCCGWCGSHLSELEVAAVFTRKALQPGVLFRKGLVQCKIWETKHWLK